MEREASAVLRFRTRRSVRLETTQQLRRLVADRVPDVLSAYQYAPTMTLFGNEEDVIDPNELHFERSYGFSIAYITFRFEKYDLPRFQVTCGRCEIQTPHKFIRAAKVVASAREQIHFWGKPWWLPDFMWSAARATREVDVVCVILPQVVEFLESGSVGGNLCVRQISPDRQSHLAVSGT